MKQIVINGWFKETIEKGKEEKPKASLDDWLDSLVLPKSFKKTAKRFKSEDLFITDIQAIVGSVFNPTYVRGVKDLSDASSTIFYIEELSVSKLEKLLDISLYDVV